MSSLLQIRRKLLDLQFPKECSLFNYQKNVPLATPFPYSETRTQFSKYARTPTWQNFLVFWRKEYYPIIKKIMPYETQGSPKFAKISAVLWNYFLIMRSLNFLSSLHVLLKISENLLPLCKNLRVALFVSVMFFGETLIEKKKCQTEFLYLPLLDRYLRGLN